MALMKDDLKQIEGVVEKVVEKEVGNLAVMVKKEFDANSKAHEENRKDHLDIREDIAHLTFLSTETVSKVEHRQLSERVSKVELKLKMNKA